jgi:hypothetical protein
MQRPIFPRVVNTINDTGAALDIIQGSVKAWFLARPDKKKELLANLLIVRAKAALKIATAATKGAKNMSDKDYEAAFHDFKEAYKELQQFMVDNGIGRRSKSGAMVLETEVAAP